MLSQRETLWIFFWNLRWSDDFEISDRSQWKVKFLNRSMKVSSPVRKLRLRFQFLSLYNQEGLDWSQIAVNHNNSQLSYESSEGHSGAILSLARCENYMCSGSVDRSIRVWDVDSLLQIRTLQGHKGPVNALCSVAKWLVSAGTEGAIRVWDVNRGWCVAHWPDPNKAPILSLAVTSSSIENRRMLSASENGIVSLWNVSYFDPRVWTVEFRFESQSVLAALFLVGQLRVAIGTDEGIVRIWDLRSGKPDHSTARLQCKGAVNALAADDKVLFSASEDRVVRAWAEFPFNPTVAQHIHHQNEVSIWQCLRKISLDGPASNLKIWRLSLSSGRLIAGAFDDGPARALVVFGPCSESPSPTTVDESDSLDSAKRLAMLSASHAMGALSAVLKLSSGRESASVGALLAGHQFGELWSGVGRRLAVWGRV